MVGKPPTDPLRDQSLTGEIDLGEDLDPLLALDPARRTEPLALQVPRGPGRGDGGLEQVTGAVHGGSP
jgi:hypothetical protein